MMLVLRSTEHPAEHRRFRDLARSDRATTDESAGSRMITTPDIVYCVNDRGHRGVYADRESANMARSEGPVIIGERGITVTAHVTIAGAVQASGQHAEAVREGL